MEEEAVVAEILHPATEGVEVRRLGGNRASYIAVVATIKSEEP